MGTKKIQPRMIQGDEPLLQNGIPTCPYCGKEVGEPDEFIALSLGISIPDCSCTKNIDDILCCLSLTFHDSHKEITNDYPIGKERYFTIIAGDEFGAMGLFCSTDCLKKWFIEHIEYVESQIK